MLKPKCTLFFLWLLCIPAKKIWHEDVPKGLSPSSSEALYQRYSVSYLQWLTEHTLTFSGKECLYVKGRQRSDDASDQLLLHLELSDGFSMDTSASFYDI
jgi:hypothetical protein